jgi:hypothetical protein
LAGGLNLYGFAGGDPVNFSDPFGLSPDCKRNPARCLLQRTLQGAAGGAVLAVATSGPGAPVTVPVGTAGGALFGMAIGTAEVISANADEISEGLHSFARGTRRFIFAVMSALSLQVSEPATPPNPCGDEIRPEQCADTGGQVDTTKTKPPQPQ